MAKKKPSRKSKKKSAKKAAPKKKLALKTKKKRRPKRNPLAAKKPRAACRSDFQSRSPREADRGLGPDSADNPATCKDCRGSEVADSESVEELAEEGQDYEAGIVSGVENAPDADQGQIKTREVPERRRSRRVSGRGITNRAGFFVQSGCCTPTANADRVRGLRKKSVF